MKGYAAFFTFSTLFDYSSPQAGNTDNFTVTSLTGTTMIWTSGETWTRSSGIAGDIVGTWTFTDSSNGNQLELTFNSDGTFSVAAQIVVSSCTNSSDVFHEVPFDSITLDGDSSDWANISSVENDAEGDDTTGYSGADIKRYKIAHDANYIYISLEMWDGPPDAAFEQAGGIYEFFFGTGFDSESFKSIGVLNVYHDGTKWSVRTAEGILTGATVAVGNSIELKILKSGFGGKVFFTTEILVHLGTTATDGDYTGRMGNYLTQIATITVDGNPADWSGLTPFYTDAQGDSSGGSNADIKSVYTAMDSSYAYVMVETYGTPIHTSAAIEMNFSYKSGQYFTHGSMDDLHTGVGNNSLNAWNDTNLDGSMETYPISGYMVARGAVMEMRIPLSQIENARFFIPTFVNIWGSGASNGDDASTIIP